MTETAVEILDTYGRRIPSGVGYAAYNCGLEDIGAAYPEELVRCQSTDGLKTTDVTIRCYRVSDGDGVLVRVTDDTDDEPVYYTLTEDVMQPFVYRLSSKTPFVVTMAAEAYEPPFDTDSATEGDGDGTRNSSGTERLSSNANEAIDDNLSTDGGSITGERTPFSITD